MWETCWENSGAFRVRSQPPLTGCQVTEFYSGLNIRRWNSFEPLFLMKGPGALSLGKAGRCLFSPFFSGQVRTGAQGRSQVLASLFLGR